VQNSKNIFTFLCQNIAFPLYFVDVEANNQQIILMTEKLSRGID